MSNPDAEKPCGEIHPLPCGLDKSCEVPADQFVAGLSSEEAWDRYSADLDQEANE